MTILNIIDGDMNSFIYKAGDTYRRNILFHIKLQGSVNYKGLRAYIIIKTKNSR